MVRLLRQRAAKHFTQVLGFNPTMVRLLPQANKNSPRPQSRFQSHNGAIAASDT